MNPQNYIIYNVTIAKPSHRNRKESNDCRSREVTEDEDVAIADYWFWLRLSENPFSKTDIRQNQRFAQQTTSDSEDKSPEAPPVERLSPLHKQKKDGLNPSFEVEVARVELASKQGTQKLSTRLVVV